MDKTEAMQLLQTAHQLAKKRGHQRPAESAEHYVAGYQAAIADHHLLDASLKRLEELAGRFFEPGSAQTARSAARLLVEIQNEIRRAQIASLDAKHTIAASATALDQHSQMEQPLAS